MDWTPWIDYASLTHVGRQRPSNQDAFGAAPAPDLETFCRQGHLFMVADGMGAHAAGELASKIAVDTIPLNYLKYAKIEPPEALRMASLTANEAIHRRGQDNYDFAGMGTTASVLIVRPETAMVAHVGDSRVYRIRGEVISQITRDHSLAWELVARGRLRRDQVEDFGRRNVIVRSVGPDPTVAVDLIGPFPLQADDRFVLCSDGLSTPVSDAEIALVASQLPPPEACQALVRLANLRGGPDNITVQVVHVRRVGPVPASNGPAASGASARGPVARLAGWARWFQRRRQAVMLVVVALAAAYVAAALLWALPGLAQAGVLLTVTLVALVVDWQAVRAARTAPVIPEQPEVVFHQETPFRVDAAPVEAILTACEQFVSEALPQAPAEVADRLQRHLAQARAAHRTGRLRDSLMACLRLLTDEFQPTWPAPGSAGRVNNSPATTPTQKK